MLQGSDHAQSLYKREEQTIRIPSSHTILNVVQRGCLQYWVALVASVASVA
jgi:hypothetical protein